MIIKFKYMFHLVEDVSLTNAINRTVFVVIGIMLIPILMVSPVMAILPQDIMKSTDLYDNEVGNSLGWDPDSDETEFLIKDGSVNPLTSTILVNIVSRSLTDPICQVVDMYKGYGFVIRCHEAAGDSDELHYTIFNLNKVITPPIPEELLSENVSDSSITGNYTVSLRSETLSQRVANHTN
jgi:hypothetical protein